MKDNKKTSILLKIVYSILAIILIGVAIYSLIKISNIIIGAIKYMFDKYTTIAVAIITGLLAFISVIVGKVIENRNIIKNQIREERQNIYRAFLDWLINNVFYAEISSNENIVNEIKIQQKNMTIYASDVVLKAWSKFKDSAMKSEKNKKGLSKEESTKYFLLNEAPKMEELILAIRKELGYKNKNIKQYDILRLYINDIDNYL